MLPSRSEIEAVAKTLPPPRVIMDAEGVAPYLSRYYLLGAPRMANGSNPFDARGDPYPEAIWDSDLGVYLHCFHQSDGRHHHNHPFPWSHSLILVGGYREEKIWKGRHNERLFLPGDSNCIEADDFHRVELIDGECWTLFTVGRKHSNWGFLNDAGAYVPWREFLQGVRA